MIPSMPLETPRTATAYRTKQQLVYRVVRDAILRCELLPDQRLIIEEIARQMNVSTIPVREALQMLQSEGLVTMVPHVGAAVSSLSRASVVDVFTVLEGLQVVAGRAAAKESRPEDLETLSRIVTEMDETVESGNYDTWADLNTKFHAAISAMPGLDLLRQSNEQALDRWDRIRRFYFNGVLVPRVAQAQREHRDLLAAFKAGESATVATLMRRHYEAALSAYLHYFDNGDGQGC
jgi:DNA-binding GntR family transcriptional regulator